MTKTILIYLILVAIISIIIATFQYLYKNSKKNNTTYILAFLRFLSVFSLLLLLINPKFKKQQIHTIKPNLVIAVDDSKSIKQTKQDNLVRNFVEKLKIDKQLNDKFQLTVFNFGNDIEQNDSLNFNQNSTNIFQSLKNLDQIHKKTISPTVLLSDGNQTVGSNYSDFRFKQDIYPVVVGDTTEYEDIQLKQLNVNKYSYLNHKFPLESFVLYEGKNNIQAVFKIMENNKIIFSKTILLNETKNVEQLSFQLPANSVGIHQYKASISYLENEKNKVNNIKNFTVEVINEQSKILLVSAIRHPDIGMFKRSVESNKQRKLIIKKPADPININDYNLIILYQPNQKFNALFSNIETNRKNYFIITGTKTNWNYLNDVQSNFSKKAIDKTENYLSNYNSNYTTFLTNDLGFSNFSPLQDYFGEITFSVPYDAILFQQIGNYSSESPLLATYQQENRRGAVLFGENSWRWRMSSQVNKKSFKNFDDFINKLIQFLSSSKRANFLEVQNKSTYYANDPVTISAQYYDANYIFDTTAKLWITIVNSDTKKQIKYPFALNKDSYQVEATNLKEGNYYFTVFDENRKNIKKGSFTILPYDIEKQFIGANKKSLTALANNSNGALFYLNEFEKLKNSLLQQKKYVSVQKSTEKITALIDWKWLLGIIALALSVEWFIRKYNGLL